MTTITSTHTHTSHTRTPIQIVQSKRWIKGKSSFNVLCHRCGHFYIWLHFGYFGSSIFGYYLFILIGFVYVVNSWMLIVIALIFLFFKITFNQWIQSELKIDLNSEDYSLAQDFLNIECWDWNEEKVEMKETKKINNKQQFRW